MKKSDNTYIARLASVVSICYFLLVGLYFSPVNLTGKIVLPLAFLTLCAIRLSHLPIVLAMGFSALGDLMGFYHNLWVQVAAFALAHIAYIFFFWRTCRQDRSTDGIKRKSLIVFLYGLAAGIFILPHVNGILQAVVSVYILLIMTMCIFAWTHKNRYYALGAWLFVISDTVLAWNMFVSPIKCAGLFIMIPYYLGQWILFVQSIRSKQEP